jgi:hypothetical protein
MSAATIIFSFTNQHFITQQVHRVADVWLFVGFQFGLTGHSSNGPKAVMANRIDGAVTIEAM